MASKILRSTIFIPLFAAALLAGCQHPVVNESLEIVRIEIYGMAVNPIDIAWIIHDRSDTVENLTLDHTGTSPFLIIQTVSVDVYGTVEVTISDSGSTGDALLASGNCTPPLQGTTKKIITLDFDTQSPVGSENYIVGEGDFLRDSASQDFYISQDPTENRIVTVYDTEENFAGIGACALYASNRSSITVTFVRDGITLHSFTGSTVTEAIDMSYGSTVW